MANDGWATGGVTGADEAVLTVIAGAQFSFRLAQCMDRGARHHRFNEAREIINRRASEKLAEGGLVDRTLRLGVDNSGLLENAFNDQQRLGLIVTALLGNPIQPFQVQINEKERTAALEYFSADLGCPETWLPTVRAAAAEALRAQASLESVVLKVGMGVIGVAAVLAAPYLVLAAAPAGLAGGAAFVAGLAALGPGGMLGGLAVVGAIAAGGGGMAATSLVAGNRRVVQQNVAFIHAIALAKRELRPRPRSTDEWQTLIAMREELQGSLQQHKRIDEKFAPTARDIARKLDDIDRALKALKKAGMGGD